MPKQKQRSSSYCVSKFKEKIQIGDNRKQTENTNYINWPQPVLPANRLQKHSKKTKLTKGDNVSILILKEDQKNNRGTTVWLDEKNNRTQLQGNWRMLIQQLGNKNNSRTQLQGDWRKLIQQFGSKNNNRTQLQGTGTCLSTIQSSGATDEQRTSTTGRVPSLMALN